MKQRAVFLDRDGTINIDKEYISQTKDVELFPGTVEALKILKELNFLLVVVSNQSGVGRGYFSQKNVEDVNHYINTLLAEEGIKIDRFYTCPHAPEEGCCCRKPSAEMVLGAAKFFNIDLKSSFFIGDKSTDVRTGLAAGCKTIWLKNKNYLLEKDLKPEYIAENLLDASKWIGNESKK